MWEWTSGNRPDEPFSDEDVEAFEVDANSLLIEVGVISPRPAVRTWYLRLPDGVTDMEAFLGDLCIAGSERGAGPGEPGFARVVAELLHERYTWNTEL